MNKVIKLSMALVVLTNVVQCNENKNEKIDFLVNECILKIPAHYDIAISNNLDIGFFSSVYYALENNLEIKNGVRFSLNLTDKNARKIVLDDLNKTQSSKIKNIVKKDNLLLIDFVEDNDEYIIGNKFYLYSSNKDDNATKELIEYCNKTWHDDMYIERLENLADKIIKDFPYTPSIALDKERALKIQKKLKSIYDRK